MVFKNLSLICHGSILVLTEVVMLEGSVLVNLGNTLWIISAAAETWVVFLSSETLCPCSWESCYSYDELFSVLLLAVNFTCDSVNGILSLPCTAGVCSTSNLPLRYFVPSCELTRCTHPARISLSLPLSLWGCFCSVKQLD